jgi:hypothetical protein
MEEEQVNEVETLGKRNNPDYSQVTALVPKALAQRLRIFCVENEMQITEAVEIAIEEFLDRRQPLPQKETPSRGTKKTDS